MANTEDLIKKAKDSIKAVEDLLAVGEEFVTHQPLDKIADLVADLRQLADDFEKKAQS